MSLELALSRGSSDRMQSAARPNFKIALWHDATGACYGEKSEEISKFLAI